MASSASNVRKPSEADLQRQMEQQLNQLVAELRLLESYYQEIVAREQTASAALSDTRQAVQAIDGLSKNSKSELLLPIGGGLLLPAKDIETKKLMVSVGAGVAIEKDMDSAKLFLQAREKELETAVTTLENQRREIGSRLDAGRAALQQMSQG